MPDSGDAPAAPEYTFLGQDEKPEAGATQVRTHRSSMCGFIPIYMPA